ncbi:hypothetical protein [Pseudomonas protegens]|uniref:hypothetical protein n=1 Tax=Pseudomonas protegens TaxID=380021 RepID=UPI00382099A9
MFVESLKNVPSEVWVGLAGIFGSLITVLGVWLTNKSNERQAILRIKHESELNRGVVRKERLEELFVLVYEWSTLLINEFIFYKSRMVNGDRLLGITALDRPARISDEASTRINMIVTIYGDGVLQYYNSAFNTSRELAEIWYDFDMSDKSSKNSTRLLGLAGDLNESLHEKLGELQKAIIRAARAT